MNSCKASPVSVARAFLVLLVMTCVQHGMARADYQSATHIFNLSNVLAPGNYGTVQAEAYTGLAGTTSHGLTPGQVRFTVQAPFLGIYGDPAAASNYGMDKFAFNTDLAIAASQIVVTTSGGTDLNWAVKFNKTVSSFGTFSILDKGDGNSRGNPIVVTVSELGGAATLPHFYFATDQGAYYVAHLGGFPAAPTSHFIAVGAPEPASAALALLATGCAGFVGWRRRRAHARG